MRDPLLSNEPNPAATMANFQTLSVERLTARADANSPHLDGRSSSDRIGTLPISVLIPTRNEVENLGPCLESLAGWADEVVVVDSNSHDGTVELARDFGAEVLSFRYEGGWPKKRQWALDTYPFRNPWTLLLDADERVTPELWREIANVIRSEGREDVDGYYVPLEMVFLGRRLRHGGFRLFKLSLFRTGKGSFERRLENQTTEMSDVEIHEHVRVPGRALPLRHALEHRNVHSLFRYLAKHNEYSTWEAEVMFQVRYGLVNGEELPASLWGNQAQRRRWIKNRIFFLPGYSVLLFLYHYIARLGFLDGLAGFLYCACQGIQRFQTKAKFLELEIERGLRRA